jgi:CRP-like cAMP-binding protein
VAGFVFVDADRLRHIPLFRDLSRRDLERLASWADEVDVKSGRRLMDEGAFPHEFMVIETGSAEVTHDGGHLADLGPGDFFGEMALLEEHRRTATVTATSDLTIIVMHERDFRAMEDVMPEVAGRIRGVMDDRRHADERRAGES